jgi:hypothetical protein
MKDMLQIFEIEPIHPDHMDRERFHMIGIGSSAARFNPYPALAMKGGDFGTSARRR